MSCNRAKRVFLTNISVLYSQSFATLVWNNQKGHFSRPTTFVLDIYIINERCCGQEGT